MARVNRAISACRNVQLSEDAEEAARKQFPKPGKEPQILIVTDKLLTGYDAMTSMEVEVKRYARFAHHRTFEETFHA